VSATGKMYVKNLSTGAKTYVWDFGDSSAQSKDKTPTHQFTASGTYTVCLRAYDSTGTCYTTYCYTVTVIKSRSKSSNVSGDMGITYPNPADAGFYINLANGSDYIIYNATGQIVKQGNGKNNTYFQTSDWAEGNYKIVVSTDQGTNTYNTIIAH
jgi:PKD repeat protein